MKHISTILLFFACTWFATGQINTLVPNGDFEDVNFCFDPINNLWRVPHWSAAVPIGVCSSDYYNKCQIDRGWTPSGPMQNVNGKGSAAIYLKNSLDPMYREYVQVKLKNNLQSENIYIVEFKIMPQYLNFQWEWGVDRIECVLSETELAANILNGFTSIIDTPASVIFKGNFFDTANWYRCKAEYRAIGGEQYLTIGIFSPDSVYDFYPIGNNLQTAWQAAYYLIDDVMVYKASDTIKKKPAPMLPNVFSPNGDGANEVYEIENLPENSTLEVFNRWGALVFKEAPYRNNWPGNSPNGNPLADGVYFAILTYQDQNGKLQQKKQTVHVVR